MYVTYSAICLSFTRALDLPVKCIIQIHISQIIPSLHSLYRSPVATVDALINDT